MGADNRVSDHQAVIGWIPPQSINGTTVSSTQIDLSKFRRVAVIVSVGAIAADVDAKVREAKDSAGTLEQDLTGKAITTLDAATDDNKLAIIEIGAEELSADYTHISVDITAASGACLVQCVVLGEVSRYKPARDLDHASVDEIVA